MAGLVKRLQDRLAGADKHRFLVLVAEVDLQRDFDFLAAARLGPAAFLRSCAASGLPPIRAHALGDFGLSDAHWSGCQSARLSRTTPAQESELCKQIVDRVTDRSERGLQCLALRHEVRHAIDERRDAVDDRDQDVREYGQHIDRHPDGANQQRADHVEQRTNGRVQPSERFPQCRERFPKARHALREELDHVPGIGLDGVRNCHEHQAHDRRDARDRARRHSGRCACCSACGLGASGTRPASAGRTCPTAEEPERFTGRRKARSSGHRTACDRRRASRELRAHERLADALKPLGEISAADARDELPSTRRGVLDFLRKNLGLVANLIPVVNDPLRRIDDAPHHTLHAGLESRGQ